MNAKIKKIFNKKNIDLLEKNFENLLVILLIVFCFYSFKNRSLIYQHLGNISFGGYFYNLEFAKFFFTLSANSTPAPMWANYQLSRIYFISGDQDKAVAYADKELELYPSNCRTNYIRGLAYAYSDRLDNAIENFKAFNICFPNTWAGNNDLAWFYFRRGDYVEAKKVLEEVQSKYTTNPWIQNSYGVALMNTGELEKALFSFMAAKKTADNMTEKDWGAAYPGNNPKIYGEGLTAMRNTINQNIIIVNEKLNK